MVAPIEAEHPHPRRRSHGRTWRPVRPHHQRPHGREVDAPRGILGWVATIAGGVGGLLVFLGCGGLPVYVVVRGLWAIVGDVFG